MKVSSLCPPIYHGHPESMNKLTLNEPAIQHFKNKLNFLQPREQTMKFATTLIYTVFGHVLIVLSINATYLRTERFHLTLFSSDWGIYM